MNRTRRVPQRPGFRIRNPDVRNVLGTRLPGLFLLVLGLGIGLNAVAAPTRVTVLPITTEDHSYRSWRGAVDLGDVVVANLGSEPDVVLVERADLSRIESERALASAGLASAQGFPPLQGAEWGVALHLGEARETRRPLRIEVIHLARGHTLFRTNHEVVVPLRSRLSGDAALAGDIASRVRDALAVARQVELSRAGLRRVLWFTTPLGSAPPGWQFILPEATDATLEESGLAAFGLTRDAETSPERSSEDLVWEPSPGILEIGNSKAGGVFPTNALPSWEEAIARMRPTPAGSEPPARRASVALQGRARQLLGGISSLDDEASRTAWRRGLSMLGHAVWLAPARVDAQELLLRARYAPWVGRASVHPLRWRYWRRDAWGEHVRRHGFDTRAMGQLDEKTGSQELTGEAPTVAWQYVYSAYAIVGSYAPGQGDGPRDQWPADLDSRVLETWWGRDLAELRTRLERTADDPGLAELRVASADEVLVYGAGPDAAGWCRWLEQHAPELRTQAGNRWQGNVAETEDQLDRLYESAGRPGEYTQVLSILTRPDPERATPAPSSAAPRLHLPHVSQLDSLAARPALDAGDWDFGPAPLPGVVRTLGLAPRTAILGLAPVGGDERWLLAEVAADLPGGIPAEVRQAIEPLTGHRRRLLRSRREGDVEPVPDHPLFLSTVGITGHRGELWGFTPSTVWRIPSGRNAPQPEAQGLTGPVFGIHSVAGHLLVAGNGVQRWLPEDRRWESLVPQLPARGPGNEIALTFQPGHVWIRRYQLMTLPAGGAQGIPDALNPPWHAWNSGRWMALPLPRVSSLQLDAATNAWCFENGSLRLFSESGTNLWPEVASHNPVVWREPGALLQVGEPLPAYLKSREGPLGLSHNESGFDREFTASELESLRATLAGRPSEGAPVSGGTRLDDPVVRVALVGDHLWVATHRERAGRHPTTRLILLHAPTRRWIAAADLPGPLKQWAAGPDGILAVTGDRQGFNREPDQVHVLDVQSLLAVPESAWLSPNPSPAELARALGSLTGRQRAIRSWALGDPRPVQTLLAGIELDVAAAEDLFLLATAGATDALRRQASDTLRRDHSRSLFTAALPVR